MAEPYIGEIKLFAFGRIPSSWHTCDGTLLEVVRYQALYSLLGTTYGGDGRTTFGLPDLRGRAIMGATTFSGGTFHCGVTGGQEVVTLTAENMPLHTHYLMVANVPAAGTAVKDATYAVVQSPTPASIYAPPTPTVALASRMLEATGGNGGHENRQPYAALSYCIALAGIYPSRA